jgi:hypothetical protein
MPERIEETLLVTTPFTHAGRRTNEATACQSVTAGSAASPSSSPSSSQWSSRPSRST